MSHQTSVISTPSPHEGQLEPTNEVLFPSIGYKYKNFLSQFELLQKYSYSIINVFGHCPQFLADFQKTLVLPLVIRVSSLC